MIQFTIVDIMLQIHVCVEMVTVLRRDAAADSAPGRNCVCNE